MSATFFKHAGMVLLFAAVLCLNGCAAEEAKAEQVKLPDAAAAAIKAAYPQGEIEEVETDTEGGVMLYEVEIKQAGKELEVSVSAEGTIVEEEQEITLAELPQAAQQAAAGAKSEETTKEMTYYVVKDKKLEKLAAPEVSYCVEIEKDGKVTEMEFNADGTARKAEAGDDEDEDEDDKDENEDD